MDFRRKILYIVESPEEENDENTSLDWYDIAMMVAILLSLVPLAFKHHTLTFEIIDKATVTVFILDYLLRWFVSDLRLKKGVASFLIYPLTPMAIFDLLTILPSLSLVSNSFKLFKLVRLLRTFRAFRVFKAVRYSKSIKTVICVFKKQKESLLVVCVMAFAYVLVSALIVFNVEPDSFGNYFDAVYWATVSLTTMGYGDIYPVTTAGRVVTMISSIMGIAIIALPAGIITSGFMDELQNQRKVDSAKDTDEQG
ncbi:MAG: ion transporter [Clostridiales bacterium]|nr:ion transporter [Clostridiales bacterium]